MAAHKLNDLLLTSSFEVLPGTFPALAAYAANAAGQDVRFFGTLAGAINSDFTGEFISPMLPRGFRAESAEDIKEGDLDYNIVQIQKIEGELCPDMIVSGHAGTREYLASQFPEAKVVSGNITAEEVKEKIVVGTLPPHLAAEAGIYVPVRVVDFDYARDGDLTGDELRKRLVISDPIKVTVL